MNPKPFSSLNHFTVPVAIGSSQEVVCCETREVLKPPLRTLALLRRTGCPARWISMLARLSARCHPRVAFERETEPRHRFPARRSRSLQPAELGAGRLSPGRGPGGHLTFGGVCCRPPTWGPLEGRLSTEPRLTALPAAPCRRPRPPPRRARSSLRCRST